MSEAVSTNTASQGIGNIQVPNVQPDAQANTSEKDGVLPTKKAKPQAEAKPEKTGYKLTKIDGTEYEVDEKSYDTAARKSLTADKRLHEATLLQKKAIEAERQAQERLAKADAWEKLSPMEQFKAMQTKLKDPNISKSFRTEIEQWLWGQIQEEQQPEEVRKMTAAEARAKEAEDKLQKIETENKNKAYEVEKAQHATQAQGDIIQILKFSELPPTEWNVKRAADLMYNARAAKVTASNEQIAGILKHDTMETAGALYGNIADGILKAREAGDSEAILKNGKALLDYMPEQVLKALRIYDLTKHLNGQPISTKKPVDVQKSESPKKEGNYEYKTMEEWQEARRKALAQA